MLFPRGLRPNTLNRRGGADIKWNGPLCNSPKFYIFSLGILSTYGSVHNFVFNFILLYDITSTVIVSLFCNVQVILI